MYPRGIHEEYVCIATLVRILKDNRHDRIQIHRGNGLYVVIVFCEEWTSFFSFLFLFFFLVSISFL